MKFSEKKNVRNCLRGRPEHLIGSNGSKYGKATKVYLLRKILAPNIEHNHASKILNRYI